MFSLRTTPRFEREFRHLLRRHAKLLELAESVRAALEDDPHNRSRKHDIKKLTDVSQGAGQYRIRVGRFRFRYDIYGDEVVLGDVSLRREDTYR